jgi:hypothetical protein
MNGKIFSMSAVAMLMIAGSAFANTLTVNNAAAMGGTGTACSGGNCGLQVNHNNSSTAFVEDRTPTSETVYRAEFLYRVRSMTTTQNLRQPIFQALSNNPNPAAPNCGAGTFASAFRCFQYQTGGVGQNANFQCFNHGNACGQAAGARLPLTVNTAVKACIEWEAGTVSPAVNGSISYAIVAAAATCPPSGDGAYTGVSSNNSSMAIQTIRMGTPQTNTFAAGETAILDFDEFRSFRTLAP